jgi:hypothetical protein
MKGTKFLSVFEVSSKLGFPLKTMYNWDNWTITTLLETPTAIQTPEEP